MIDTDKPSKTRLKKDMHALQAIGARLVDLSDAQFAAIALPEELREAVAHARRITKHEARRRQLQYIGKLMREIDAAPIREQLARWDGQSHEAARTLHDVERWRDRLIADDAALTELAARHRGLDVQALRTAIREARREAALPVTTQERPRKHYREVFRLVRAALEGGAQQDDAEEADDE